LKSILGKNRRKNQEKERFRYERENRSFKVIQRIHPVNFSQRVKKMFPGGYDYWIGIIAL
jgi:hypothetical protein